MSERDSQDNQIMMEGSHHISLKKKQKENQPTLHRSDARQIFIIPYHGYWKVPSAEMTGGGVLLILE